MTAQTRTMNMLAGGQPHASRSRSMENEEPGTGKGVWMRIREGILESKHRRAMGEAVWLYLYLHKEANWSTGVISRYRHDEAAAALDMPLRTVKRQMARLEGAGYISSARSKGYSQVTICRYKVSEMGSGAPRQVPSMALLKEEEVSRVALVTPQEVPSMAPVSPSLEPEMRGEKCHSWSQEVPPVSRGLYTRDSDNTTPNGVGADAPCADAQEPTGHTLISQPPQSRKRPRRAKVQAEQKAPAAPRPEQPQYRVFLALCQAAEANPLDMDGHKGRACKEAVVALGALTARYAREDRTDAPGDAERDLRAMVTWRVRTWQHKRRGDPLPPGLVGMAYQDMAAWKAAGSPGGVTVAPPPGRIVPPWERPKVAPAPPEPAPPAPARSPESMRILTDFRAQAAEGRQRRLAEEMRWHTPPIFPAAARSW